ncbi:LysR family transcriptional regulator [Salinarimonas sp. NSM]|uniref:LysR family transcriptional regulator n=1 Tax=Salinarimonas sp. NSM TaxID=3458003 RepID=UPI004037219F
MNLTFLETFVWVAHLRSFTLAAERMHATQAAVSARIASLERELGVKLFLREPRDVRLTPEGARALAHAARMLRGGKEFYRDVAAGAGLRGPARGGVIDTISHTWLIDFIRRSRATHPRIDLELVADTSLRLIDMLVAGEIDLGLIMGPVGGPEMVDIDLCTYASAWLASPALGLHGGPLDIGDLVRHAIVSFPRCSQPHQAMMRYFSRFPEDETTFYSTNSLATIIRMTVDGIGIAAIPPTVVRRELERGELVRLDVRQPFPPLGFQATFRDGPTSHLPAALADLAREVARDFCAAQDPALAW